MDTITQNVLILICDTHFGPIYKKKLCQ